MDAVLKVKNPLAHLLIDYKFYGNNKVIIINIYACQWFNIIALNKCVIGMCACMRLSLLKKKTYRVTLVLLCVDSILELRRAVI